MALSYLTLSVTQGGADAFAISSASTGLQGQTTRAYRIRELLTEIPRFGNGVGLNVELALCRRTKAAMPNISDRDVIYKRKTCVELTTSGVGVNEGVRREFFAEDDELLIVEDDIFLAVDSNATTLTQTFFARVGYELVNINAVERLTLLTQSLTN